MSSPQFIGTHAATLDQEGRIQLPAAIRDEVNVRQQDFRLMASWEPDGSLCLRTQEAWADWMGALQRRRPRDQRDRATLLTVAAHSAPVKCDKQGRIRVPDALLALLGIQRADPAGRDVVLTGAFGELRLWSPGGWLAFSEQARPALGEGIDALLTSLGRQERATETSTEGTANGPGPPVTA